MAAGSAGPDGPGPGGRADRRRAFGAAGEDRAAAWYVDHGYSVVDRNWRGSGRKGEIDLVVRKGRFLVFSEVKARVGDRYGEPFEAVTRVKQARIRGLAAEWLRCRGPVLEVRAEEIRFDVVSIKGKDIDVLEGAF